MVIGILSAMTMFAADEFIATSRATAVINSTLKRKFAGRAKSIGLLQTNNKNSAPYTDGDVVWMMVLQL